MPSFKEQRIRKITNLYYSRSDVQKIIYEFSKNREICPMYFEGLGKRPDSFQYPGDIFEMVKKGATSFHCSEELWEDPMKIVTGMKEEQANELRIGWDLLIDIDCQWFDYSKLAAQAIIKVFNNHGVKNVGVKFSGNKGFHIILPWKSFPKQIAGQETKDLFPELPRKIISYISFKAEEIMKKSLPEDFYSQFKDVKIRKGIKCNNCRSVALEYESINYYCPKCHRRELKKIIIDGEREYKCPDCRVDFEIKDSKKFYECRKCNLTSEKSPSNFSKNIEVDLFDLMGLDLVMISPRHLFRMPYSLHEKTALASVVLDASEISNFDLKHADALKAQVKEFVPDCEEGEAKELVREALDWVKENQIKSGVSEEKIQGKYADFKPITLKNIEDSQFPSSVKKILEGMNDGKKRGLFVLINLFRSIGMDKEELEKRIYEWNERNKPQLKEGYIKSQLSWSYRKKPILPPNYGNNYYRNIGIIPSGEELRFKNPVNYVIRKNLGGKRKRKKD